MQTHEVFPKRSLDMDDVVTGNFAEVHESILSEVIPGHSGEELSTCC